MTHEPKLFPYITRLLQGASVEWKPLGEVTEYEQPTAYLVKSTNYKDAYPTPVLTAGKTFILGYTDETDGIYQASLHPVIIFDDFTTAHKWVDFDFKAKSSAMKMIISKDESQVLLRYIYHWLNTLPSELAEGDHKRQWISNFSNKKIPLHPLPVQQEIVRILDKFTTLEAELEAELEARKKQYAYYRDQLLNFSQCPPLNVNIEWKTLGEVAEFKRGQTIIQKTAQTGVYPVISGGQQPAYYIDQYNRTGQTITVAGSGAYAGFVMFWDEPIFVSDAFSIKTDEEVVLPRYVFHFLLNKQSSIFNLKRGAGVPHVYAKDLAAFSIPLPPLSEQRRIVDILDRFDTLTNSISEGLPKEIALRRKQYAYYRDTLLSFPRPEATA